MFQLLFYYCGQVNNLHHVASWSLFVLEKWIISWTTYCYYLCVVVLVTSQNAVIVCVSSYWVNGSDYFFHILNEFINTHAQLLQGWLATYWNKSIWSYYIVLPLLYGMFTTQRIWRKKTFWMSENQDMLV